MRFGDVVFEGGKSAFSGAIQLAQFFLSGKDRRIGTRRALRVRHGMARGSQTPLDVRRGVRLRREVLPHQARLPSAEADPAAVPGDHECRRLGRGAPFRGQALRHDLHPHQGPEHGGGAQRHRRSADACAQGIRPGNSGVGKLLLRDRRHRRGGAEFPRVVRARERRLARRSTISSA